jgi:RNA polymerase sigma-70 factor, ECF subfamily
LPDRSKGDLLTDRASATPASDYAPLVRAAQRGDREAFEALYARFGRFVHALLLARVPAVEAADLTQEVFLQAWLRLGALREPAAFAGWIATVARRRATDYLRRARNEVPLDERLPARGGPEASVEAGVALAAIRALPEAYRETLALRLVEGYSGPEIAALTGLTPDSVRVNLHRGFKLLRERLGQPS